MSLRIASLTRSAQAGHTDTRTISDLFPFPPPFSHVMGCPSSYPAVTKALAPSPSEVFALQGHKQGSGTQTQVPGLARQTFS